VSAVTILIQMIAWWWLNSPAIRHHGKLQRPFRIFGAMNQALNDSLTEEQSFIHSNIAFNKTAEQS